MSLKSNMQLYGSQKIAKEILEMFPVRLNHMILKMDKWDALVEIEFDSSQQEKLNELRRKYVTKMLLSDMNLKKDLVVGKLDVYDNIPEHIRKQFGTKKHLGRIEARLKTISF